MDHSFVLLSEQPALAPLVAGWILDEFSYPGGPDLAAMTGRFLETPDGPEETFVLFADGRPAGTASLAHHDLDARPDLTPWLAGVVVLPAFRGRGFGTALVRRVETFAVAAAVPTMWLYTWTAEPLYAGLGWQRAGLERDKGQDVVLMRRDLPIPQAD